MHTMLIGDREIHLKFTAKNVMAMEETAAEALFGSKRYMSVEELLNGIDRMNVLIYLFRKAIDWKGSGAKPAEAEDLYDTYMESGELDTGERYKEFQLEVATAMAASRGIDLKKAMELATAEAEKKASLGTGI
jgi:hypothetical protein